MTSPSLMSPLRALLVCSPLLLAACTAQVIGGGLTGGGGSGGSTGTAGGGTGSVGGSDGSGGTLEGPPNAIAMTRAQTDAAWDIYWQTHGGGSGSSSSGGDPLDPNDLFLRFTDLGEACSLPITDLPCGGHWEVTLVLPPSLQQVGVYDLSDPLLVQYSSASETGAESSPPSEECSWGGGSLGEGSLEIVSLDATQVHFRVTLTSGIWQNVQGGEYTAERCP